MSCVVSVCVCGSAVPKFNVLLLRLQEAPPHHCPPCWADAGLLIHRQATIKNAPETLGRINKRDIKRATDITKGLFVVALQRWSRNGTVLNTPLAALNRCVNDYVFAGRAHRLHRLNP